jgi:cytochrome c oxidase subunit 4
MDHAAHADAHGHDDHGGIGKYLYVTVALVLLSTGSFITTSSWWPLHDQPHVGWALMMAISCCKALLVILFFMHVKYEANWKYVLTIPAAFMSIFLILMLIPDVGMRNRYASSERKLFMANPVQTDAGHAESGAYDTHDDDEDE